MCQTKLSQFAIPVDISPPIAMADKKGKHSLTITRYFFQLRMYSVVQTSLWDDMIHPPLLFPPRTQPFKNFAKEMGKGDTSWLPPHPS